MRSQGKLKVEQHNKGMETVCCEAEPSNVTRMITFGELRGKEIEEAIFKTERQKEIAKLRNVEPQI